MATVAAGPARSPRVMAVSRVRQISQRGRMVATGSGGPDVDPTKLQEETTPHHGDHSLTLASETEWVNISAFNNLKGLSAIIKHLV